MQIDFELMKSSYACIKGVTCDQCDVHTDQVVVAPGRIMNNKIYFCPSPEKKAAAKVGSGAWKKSKAAKGE